MTIEQTSTGTLVFLTCGCSAWRGVTHPTGEAAMVEIINPCVAHATERVRFRAVPKGEAVNPWVRQSIRIDPIRAR